MPYLVAKRVFSDGRELQDQVIETENGKILSIRPREDFPEIPRDAVLYDCVAPGFIDIHINGGETYHFTQSPTAEALEDILSASRKTGTPYVLPTCITSPADNIMRAIAATREWMREAPHSGILGMHLEGPFINPVKRGAHLLSYIAQPPGQLLQALKEEGGETVRMLTLAPELFAPGELAELEEAGITVSAGHSNATYSEAGKAFDAGVRICTHLYNAMSSFGHRAPGLVGAVFDTSEVYAPIILDGVHCDYAAGRIAYRQKKDRLILISDALFLGRKKERFSWGEFDAALINDRYVNREGNLAGGAASLPETLANAVTHVGIPLAEAVEMVTLRPAKVLKLENDLGRIAAGYPAVFTVFNSDLTEFKCLEL